MIRIFRGAITNTGISVLIIGRWYRNPFLGYISTQASDPSKGIRNLMVTTQALYIIIEEEVIKYTLGQLGI